jgi:hypothetical protein
VVFGIFTASPNTATLRWGFLRRQPNCQKNRRCRPNFGAFSSLGKESLVFVLVAFFHSQMIHTRAQHLYYSLCFALQRLKIQGRRGVLTEHDRTEIATTVVDRLRSHGDPWELSKEMEDRAGPMDTGRFMRASD